MPHAIFSPELQSSLLDVAMQRYERAEAREAALLKAVKGLAGALKDMLDCHDQFLADKLIDEIELAAFEGFFMTDADCAKSALTEHKDIIEEANKGE